MARKFSALRAALPPETNARIETRAQAMLREIDLASIRQARGFSQQQVAMAMQLQQPAVAKIENRSDMLVSTLVKYVSAVGSVLKIAVEPAHVASPRTQPEAHATSSITHGDAHVSVETVVRSPARVGVFSIALPWSTGSKCKASR